MNENILAATGGLNKSVPLGCVEPLHSTFSHHVVSAGSKIDHELPVPANRHARPAYDTRSARTLIEHKRHPDSGKKTIIIAAHFALLPVLPLIFPCLARTWPVLG